MDKRFLLAIALAVPMLAISQTSYDAYQLSRYDLRGTARFMSMGGAFTALGGDLSTLNQNPGGIGVYRKSDIGLTLDIDMQSAKSTSSLGQWKDSQTKVSVPNFGYIGSFYTGSNIMPFFNWGFSYGRVASFNRRYKGSLDMNGSLSNYIAAISDGLNSDYLSNTEDNYFASDNAPWMSILAYNSYIMNPVGSPKSTNYAGLWNSTKTYGVSDFDVEEKGYVDEYELNLGGNFSDMVYWGIGFGITDIDYQRAAYYGEYLDYAQLPVLDANGAPVAGPPTQVTKPDGTVSDTGFDLNSAKRVTGTGFNFKVGLIIRPINELRIGLAVHTPTYYNLTENSYGDIRSYYGFNYKDGAYTGPTTVDVGTPIETLNWKLRTPWRFMAGVAGVIGSQAIVSLDYEYRPYQSMTAKFDNGENCPDINGDIKDCYQSSNIIRLGAEYRLSPNWSVRAGYAFESTPTKTEVLDGNQQVFVYNPYESGTIPSYTLDRSTNYISCGLGYRSHGFYIDAAYVHRAQKTEYLPYTPNRYTETPENAQISLNSNNLVFTIGYKF